MKKKKRGIPAHYDSLDAPVFVWNKVHESQDMSWLLVKKQKVSNRILAKLTLAWEKIYNEYLSVFGASEKFLAVKRKEISIALRKLKFIETGDRTELTWIEIEEEELQVMREELNRGSFGQSKIAIETRLKFQINPHTTSIREFYDYLTLLKK